MIASVGGAYVVINRYYFGHTFVQCTKSACPFKTDERDRAFFLIQEFSE